MPPELQNQSGLNGEALYVTADLTLDNNQRVIVLEKRPLPSPTAGPKEEGSTQGPSFQRPRRDRAKIPRTCQRIG